MLNEKDQKAQWKGSEKKAQHTIVTCSHPTSQAQKIYAFTKLNGISLHFALGGLANHYKVFVNSSLCRFTKKALVYQYKTSLVHNQQSCFLLDKAVRYPRNSSCDLRPSKFMGQALLSMNYQQAHTSTFVATN